jgi:glycosyltransferase involved in cell wall biosynthesis
VAVLIPCHNEATAIPHVIRSFLDQLLDAIVYIYDNNSMDKTVEVAAQNGTIVRSEMQQGICSQLFFRATQTWDKGNKSTLRSKQSIR